MKGVWCSGCHRPQINHGGAPEMGLIKGVGQEKGGAFPCKAILPIHNVITMACWEWGKSRARVKCTAHCSSLVNPRRACARGLR